MWDPEEDDEETPEPETPEVARAKFELVQEAFAVRELQRRVWVKTTSKQPVLDSVGWEVTRKLADDTADRPEGPVPAVATLKFAAVDPDSYYYDERPPEIVMVADAEDVAFLIDVLTRVRSQLQAASADKK
jgi:hypothetical protein